MHTDFVHIIDPVNDDMALIDLDFRLKAVEDKQQYIL